MIGPLLGQALSPHGPPRPWRRGGRVRPRQRQRYRGRAAVPLPPPGREDGLGLAHPQRGANTAEVLAAPRSVVALAVDVGVARPTLPAFAVHVILPLAADVELGVAAAHHGLSASSLQHLSPSARDHPWPSTHICRPVCTAHCSLPSMMAASYVILTRQALALVRSSRCRTTRSIVAPTPGTPKGAGTPQPVSHHVAHRDGRPLRAGRASASRVRAGRGHDHRDDARPRTPGWGSGTASAVAAGPITC